VVGLLLPLAMSVLTSSTFIDVHERFQVVLPKGWEFAPQPGDTSGASFRIKRDGLVAQVSLRALELTEFFDLDTFVKRVNSYERQPKSFKLVGQKKSHLGALMSIKRQYTLPVKGHGSWEKLVEERYAVWGPYSFVFHAEAIAEGFSSFLNDIEAIAQSFKPVIDGRVIVGDASSVPFHGQWYMSVLKPSILSFGANYDFSMDDVSGRYWFNQNRIFVFMRGGKEEFTWRVVDDVLFLTGQSFDKEMRYLRKSTWEKQSALAKKLIGSWKNEKHEVVFKGYAEVIFDQSPGAYSFSGKMLSMVIGSFEETFAFRIKAGTLTLDPVDKTSGVTKMVLRQNLVDHP